ncbi:MAG: MarR family transcriptional regulator [Pseudothermotoga sp.]|nr:MarR family transcriptional regulator [Pseudothermotoga sp.]
MNVEGRKIVEAIIELTLTFSKMIKFHPELEKLRAVELYTLFYLLRHGPCKMKDLAQALSMTKANITHLVDALERKGFVQRILNDLDRRIVHVYVTNYGKKIYDELIEELSKLVENVASKLKPADLVIISRGFEKFLAEFSLRGEQNDRCDWWHRTSWKCTRSKTGRNW